jgi:anti-sigma B factor antagonist
MDSLTVSERYRRDVVVVDLEGKVTTGEPITQIKQVTRRLVADGSRRVLLNLEKVTYTDSSGLGEIIACYSILREHEGMLKLVQVPPRVLELLRITKLDTVVEIFDSEDEGVDSFDNDASPAADPVDGNATAPLVTMNSMPQHNVAHK